MESSSPRAVVAGPRENRSPRRARSPHSHHARYSALDDAFTIALTFDRSVYDSLYVAAALAAKTHLLTADERFANALAAHLPVKWLGSFHWQFAEKGMVRIRAPL